MQQQVANNLIVRLLGRRSEIVECKSNNKSNARTLNRFLRRRKRYHISLASKPSWCSPLSNPPDSQAALDIPFADDELNRHFGLLFKMITKYNKTLSLFDFEDSLLFRWSPDLTQRVSEPASV